MADLSTMFNQLGPAGGSILAGVQMGNEANAAKSEQAMRQAQMDKILMDTDQAKLMNPLELQAKQQAIESAKFKAIQDKDLHRIDTLGRALPDIKAAPDATKHAVMEQAFINAGLPLDPQTKQQLYSMDGKTLTKFLEDKYTFAITNSPAYRQAMDLELERTKSHKYAADTSAAAQRYAADQRARIAKDRATADKSLSQDLSAAKTYQAQAVVYTNHAEKARQAGDDTEYVRLSELAKQATANDLQAKAAAGDAAAAQKLRMLQGLGVPMDDVPPATPPAAPASAAASPRKPIGSY